MELTPGLHRADNQGEHGEPDGGWTQGPQLSDAEILSIVLCRYTGDRVPLETVCAARVLLRHPDVDCRALYHQQDALRAGRVHYDMTAGEVTVSAGGAEPTYQHPLA